MDNKWLTPSQIEDLEEGYSVVVTLDAGALDTMHAHLTLDWCDGSGRALWNDIQKQMTAQRFLRSAAKAVNEAT
jgi:hypothetical protein